MKVPDIYPITDLRQDATNLVGRVCESGQPLYITQRGRAAAVLLSVEAWQKTQRELEILRILSRGEQESAAGAGHDLAEVMAAARQLLADKGL
jgi:prevent-host-death family protein